MNALVGFAGDIFSLWAGIALSLAFWWFILSYWLDGAKLILATVGVNAAFYLAAALFGGDLALGNRLLVVLGIGLGAVLVAKYWLWREAKKYGPHSG